MKRFVYTFIACACFALIGCDSKNTPSADFCVITETQVTSLSATEAVIHYMMEYPAITDYQWPEIKKFGVYYSTTNSNPKSGDLTVALDHSGTGAMGLDVPISGLQPKTHYYVRGFVRDALETEVLGEVIEFNTPAVVIEPNTLSMICYDATGVDINTAVGNGAISIGSAMVGKITECGFICAPESPVTITSPAIRRSYWNEEYNAISSWSGEVVKSCTFRNLVPSETYYYCMYYKIGSEIVYSNEKSFTTLAVQNATTMTVDQLIDHYNSLGLEDGQMAEGYYTVRGYVTKWTSGYPNYPNASFSIDNSANVTGRIACYQLMGINDSDKHQLKIGDYVEVRDCRLQNYKGQLELCNGHFTVITAAQ